MNAKTASGTDAWYPPVDKTAQTVKVTVSMFGRGRRS